MEKWRKLLRIFPKSQVPSPQKNRIIASGKKISKVIRKIKLPEKKKSLEKIESKETPATEMTEKPSEAIKTENSKVSEKEIPDQFDRDDGSEELKNEPIQEDEEMENKQSSENSKEIKEKIFKKEESIKRN